MKCWLWITGQLEVVAGDFDDEDDEDFESDEGLSLDELDFSEELDLSLELELSELALEPSELADELALEELLVLELLAASRLSLR
jgi:hypothetical protein